MKIFAAHNPDDEIRRESSAGGIFSMLAEHIISEGGAVYGASFDSDCRVRHVRIDTIEELWRLRGSKYVFSEFKSIHLGIERDIEDGRKVLFSGTPCQVAAMRKRFGNNPALLLVETVCHGAPQPEYWESYLDELCQKLGKPVADIEMINFRDKRTGWKNYSFTIRFKDGKTFTQLHDDNLYMRAFLRDLTLRKGCFVCPFKYPDGSKADITLGDFWGITQLAPEIDNDQGTTIVIVRTEKGMKCVDTINQDYLFALEDVDQYNPAITTPSKEPKDYSKFQTKAKTSRFLYIAKKYAAMPLWLRLKIHLYRIMH